MHIRLIVLGAALAVGGVLPLAPAEAQDLAKEGRIDAVVTDTTTGKGLDLGGNRVLYALDSVLVARGADGAGDGGVLDGMTGHCLGLEEVESDTGAGTLNGHCTYTDADGDKIFEALRIERPSGGEEASGKATLTGGTGKFEGIRGEVTHTRRLLPSPTDGVYPGIGRITGSYTIE